jgi:hypothetical protein
MPLLPKFDPPANLSDFARAASAAHKARQAPSTAKANRPSAAHPAPAGPPKLTAAQQWNRYISACFDVSIAELLDSIPNPPGQPHTPQFFNAARIDAGPDFIEQPVYWNAFPKRLLTRFGRERALEAADMLWPHEEATSNTFDPFLATNLSKLARACAGRAPPAHSTQRWVRPQDEYCEWRVERDRTGRIKRVTFTSEPPEYWTALYGGDVVVGDTELTYHFDGSPTYCAQLYSSFMRRPITAAQLKDPGGNYDPMNGWNTTHGIAHLSNIDVNSIAAEIKLAADSTVLRLGYQGPAAHWASARGLVVHPEHLCCVSKYGDPMRNSDPTIGACGNAMARTGALFTLKNPVGIYLDHIDTSGWELKGRRGRVDWRKWCVVTRGDAAHIERVVVQAPKGSGATLADLMIGGEELKFGGQIAECITVRLTGIGTISHHLRNPAATAHGQGWMRIKDPRQLKAFKVGASPPAGKRQAFGPSVTSAGQAVATPPPHERRGRRRAP